VAEEIPEVFQTLFTKEHVRF